MRERRPGSWELRVYAGVDPDTYRRRYRTATVHGNRADSEGALDELVAAVRADHDPPDPLRARPLPPSAPRQPPGRRGHPCGDRCLLRPPAPCGGTRGQPLSPGTLARIHVVLRSAFAQAVRWGWVWDNPAERAHRIVATPRELEPPSPAELSELFAAIVGRDQQLHMFVVLAAVTGARRAQLLGLRWHNVDLAHGRVAFCAGWVEGPNGPVLADTKTKRRHMVDLDVATVALLCTHHDSVGDAAVPDHFVFSDDDGVTAWKPNRVTKAFVRHRRAAGLRPFRLHDLRHFMATEMLQAGIPLATVARRLDHRRVSTTLDRYAHAVPGGDATAATALRAIIDHAR